MNPVLQKIHRVSTIYRAVALMLLCMFAAPVSAADLCPNTLFNDGKMWSGDIQYVDNTCSNTDQVCSQTYFSDLGARFDAVCTGTQWIQQGTEPEPETPPETGVETGVADLCPNTLFNNGKMWSGNIQYVDNTCSNAEQVCPQTYFSDLAARLDAVCTGVKWAQVGSESDQGSGSQETESDPEAPLEPETNVVDLCPNTLFDDGKMWSGDIQYVDNTCTSSDQLCSDVYFADVAGRFDATCNGSMWVAVNADSGGESGPSTPSESNTATNQHGGPLAEKFDDLMPALSTATYASSLVGCAALDFEEYEPSYSCALSELPFIGQEITSPSIDDIMARVVVSHAWMGERFRDALEAMPADVLIMFRAVTVIVIDADIRPSYYWTGTGAIYLDPFYLWTTNSEKQTINAQQDFRANFGAELDFIDTWRYTFNNAFAFPSWSLNNNVERSVQQMSMDLLRLLYHELAHANDFMPPAELAGLSLNDSVREAIDNIEEKRVSNVLYNDFPATSQLMIDLAQARFKTGEPTSDQVTYSAALVGSEHANDVPNHFYGYFTPREDLAMMFEAVMMKRNFNIDMDIGYLDRPTVANPFCDDYKVGWGKRNLIGSDLVKNRAIFVAATLLPELDWNTFSENLEGDRDMVAGAGWCENLALDNLRGITGRSRTSNPGTGEQWRDLSPRIH